MKVFHAYRLFFSENQGIIAAMLLFILPFQDFSHEQIDFCPDVPFSIF